MFNKKALFLALSLIATKTIHPACAVYASKCVTIPATPLHSTQPISQEQILKFVVKVIEKDLAQLLELMLNLELISADSYCNNSWHSTLIMLALYHKSTDCVKLLIERGVDLALLDKNGDSALEYCSSEEMRTLLVNSTLEQKHIKSLTVSCHI